MVTDPQMARRNDTEHSRFVQTDSGPGRSASQELQDSEVPGTGTHVRYTSVSDAEDDEDYEGHSNGESCLPPQFRITTPQMSPFGGSSLP